MRNRLVIMTQRPGRTERTIPIALERPRATAAAPISFQVRGEILELFHFAGNASRQGTAEIVEAMKR